jgi:hypothetical protein
METVGHAGTELSGMNRISLIVAVKNVISIY